MTEKKECRSLRRSVGIPGQRNGHAERGGKDVGISCLDDVMNEVLSLNIEDETEIRKELLNRIKDRDYIPPKAEAEYSDALLTEYKKRT